MTRNRRNRNPPPDESLILSPRSRIRQRLQYLRIPVLNDTSPIFLVEFIKNHEVSIPSLVSCILPSNAEIKRLFVRESAKGVRSAKLMEFYAESLLWIQWLMFGCDPEDCLKDMAQKAAGQRAVCGLIWGENHVAYRCQTCQKDPTCVMCVPCFQNGNHKDHDYSAIVTTVGCCDCGDETALKRAGFCSKHKGIRQVQSLSGELANSAEHVIDSLLSCWQDKLMSMELRKLPRDICHNDAKKVVNELTNAVIGMLLVFCNCSESLLSFISRRISMCSGLVGGLVKAVRFLDNMVVTKVDKLLLKLLRDTQFKYEFAKFLIEYYPVIVNKIIKVGNDSMIGLDLFPAFSVQIFTVSTVTSRLVREVDLLFVLLRCLTDLFLSFVGKDGCFQVVKYVEANDITNHFIENTRYAMSHREVQIYIARERRDILIAWLRLLSLTQDMYPLKREINKHIENDNNNVNDAFELCHQLSNIQPLLVGGVCDATARGNCPSVSASAVWLISECLKTIERSLSRVGINGNQGPSDHERLVTVLSGEKEALAQDSDLLDVSGILEDINSGRELEAFKVMSLVDWPNIKYDVSSKEISFHLPLHRFLSLLLRKELKTCYEETMALDESIGKLSHASFKPHNFFQLVLEGTHPSGFSAYIMENPLRLRVFCAQARAGMWCRNGSVVTSSCELYCDVAWFEIGVETDLFLLQCCAALAPPDLFVKRIQERFGLTSYTSLNRADHNEYEPVLVEEMLTLIIQIVSERRFCGLSTTENLRREMVCRLAISDATHNELVKGLSRDLSKCDQLQNILDMLAVYSMPSGLKQGIYSLRKAFWKELDLYHPRWKSNDLQVAGERYLHFCKVSALNAQLPRWTTIFNPLNTISRIATSKSVLQIIRAVLFYAVCTETSSLSRVPDNVVITALHLLSLALDICDTKLSSDQRSYMDKSGQDEDSFPLLIYASEVFSKNHSLLSLLGSLMMKHKESVHDNCDYGHYIISRLIENIVKKFKKSLICLVKSNRLAPEIISHIPRHSSDTSVDNLASASVMAEKKAKGLEHQAAVLAKFKTEQAKFVALVHEADGGADVSKSDQMVSVSAPKESALICSFCRDPDPGSPLYFLILLQKSQLTSLVERGLISWDDAEKSDNKMCPSASRGVIESSGDVSYGIEPADIYTFQDLIDEFLPEAKDTQACASSQSSQMMLEKLENDAYQSIVRKCCSAQYCSDVQHGNSNCSTAQVALGSQQSKSAESCVRRNAHPANVSDSTFQATRYSVFGPRDCDGIHISSCGHAVHQECLDQYLTTLMISHLLGGTFEGDKIVDPLLGELLCPQCRRFTNSILPVFPSVVSNRQIKQIESSKDNLHLPLSLSLLQCTAEVVGESQLLEAVSGKQSVTVNPVLEPALRKLCALYSSHSYDNLSESGRLIQSLNLWDTITYTLTSTEIVARGKSKTSFSGSLSLESLYAEFYSSSEFILSSLLRVALTARVSSHHDVFLRFKGIQLLAGSICIGVSEVKSSNSDKKRGTLSSILEHADNGEAIPYILFFKRVSDPILAHDPFSSLMWTLFCLPFPFISSNEFFIHLVHLFYYVCIVQALVTCYSKSYFDVSCFNDSALNDICKMMGESDFVRKYFISNYIDMSCHPMDMIRQFTFPYLRKCALLRKMLQPLMSASLNGSSLIWESNLYAKDNALDRTVTLELNGIKELEHAFQIQSLESVLNDSVMLSSACKWCSHFCQVFSVRSCGAALFSTPAVPFRLIQLPRLYQDLLERYVKRRCSSCKSVLDKPALCLLCGRLCSSNQEEPCCRASSCLIHGSSCGAGIGVFLFVRRTTVFLQRSMRQSIWPSPYLDAFGEEDHYMKRGRPLYLNEERYSALTYLVSSHGLDQTSEVLSRTTITRNHSE